MAMVDRRRFLKYAAVFGGFALSPLALFGTLGGDGMAGRLARLAVNFKQLRIFFEAENTPANGPSFMAGLGEFYRAQHPAVSPPADADALAKAITEDFEADRLVIYKGWVFAETEARLMAELPVPARR
jgi:hypothetical protein